MELLATRGAKAVWFGQLTAPYDLTDPFAGEPYACVLFADGAVTVDEQAALSRQLVATGCRDAVCAGHDCASWDRSVDVAYLDAVNAALELGGDAGPPVPYVMTSWHEGASVEAVMTHGLVCTTVDDQEPTRILVLALGPQPGLRDEAARAIHTIWSTAS